MNRLVLTAPLLALIALSACGRGRAERDPAEDAARSMVAQFALFCPNEDLSWEAFDAMARRLGVAPDGGEAIRPVTVRSSEIVREQWVALNHLGHRTTAWIAEVGPGVRYHDGVAPVRHTSGLVCVVHDPEISREEAFTLVRGDNDGGRITGADRSPEEPGRLVPLVKTWVNSTGRTGFYQDTEMRVRDIAASDGAMMIRHRFLYGEAANAAPASKPDDPG
ncbi:hypothetical protein [Brevundimonas sp. FT23042]|uniref:hypothetical protein n=1 Tax=Brevundimonas sp. FT23042 TaxID=3393749 RepID=UPI003B58ADA4